MELFCPVSCLRDATPCFGVSRERAGVGSRYEPTFRGAGVKARSFSRAARSGVGSDRRPGRATGACPIGPAGAVASFERRSARVGLKARSKLSNARRRHEKLTHDFALAARPSQTFFILNRRLREGLVLSRRSTFLPLNNYSETTLSGGSLGSRVDEERGQPRELV